MRVYTDEGKVQAFFLAEEAVVVFFAGATSSSSPYFTKISVYPPDILAFFFLRSS